ncbi:MULTISPECIES: 50S ribosomal protein L11 methyltransferase [unclassified Roseitalea]|uniref:50S ribosomal protein L11 methyltransferase n=1 Tax=unclassified Roseitalea TaxID=2639107 RepID=UPI00273DDF3E|nr:MULTISPECIES: 50S ribosomal protein L11 methyltransferase [unclassified Roseitalea]
MRQTRLFLTAPRDEAAALFERIDAAFEDDGPALALTEIDEDTGLSEVSVYARTDPDTIAAITQTIARALDRPVQALGLRSEELPDIDWVARSLEGLGAVRAGRFVVHGCHARDAVRAGDIAILIEAGQAFGTGHHGTTAGCLIMLERIVARRRPQASLDLGTGSAVLAIAIARRARTPVLATDIDPVATRIARRNVRLNGVSTLVGCQTATGFSHPVFAMRGPFDLIVANILARPLMRMAPDIARHLAAGGDVVLSGILERQRWPVLAAFRQAGLHHCRTIARQGWVTLHLRR